MALINQKGRTNYLPPRVNISFLALDFRLTFTPTKAMSFDWLGGVLDVGRKEENKGGKRNNGYEENDRKKVGPRRCTNTGGYNPLLIRYCCPPANHLCSKMFVKPGT